MEESMFPVNPELYYNAEQIQQRDRILQTVAFLMQWDKEKARTWYKHKNPLLGNVSPEFMVRIGRGDKVLKFIQAAIDGEFP